MLKNTVDVGAPSKTNFIGEVMNMSIERELLNKAI